MQNYLTQYWGYLNIDQNGYIRNINDKAVSLLGDHVTTGRYFVDVLPWLQKNLIRYSNTPSIIKISTGEEILLDVFEDTKISGSFHLFFRKVKEYQDQVNISCKIFNVTIDLQEFIDRSYDGIVLVDGAGVLIAANNSFYNISGLTREAIIGKKSMKLVETGILSCSVANIAIKERKIASAIVKYPSGKEAMVTSTPMYNECGEIILVVSNARDVTELNTLHDELKNTKQLVQQFREELKAIQTAKKINICNTCSPIMERLYELTTKVAKTDLQLLITGETGVGKTALANYIHLLSERENKGNFIHINCSAIPEPLLESELFGHEEGAYTGAKKSKAGLFEMANGGTVFLDEIGNMPLSLQAKLLNVLQEKRFYRVGGTKEINVDVRIIAATNADLEQLVAEKLFREDLYYRLNVIPLRIPSLAERKEDLPPLINYYMEQTNKKYKCSKKLSPEVMGIMLRYNWPGNIRELITFIERVFIMVDENTIEIQHLKNIIVDKRLSKLMQKTDAINQNNNSNQLWQPNTHLKDLLTQLEDQIIEEAITKCGSFKEASISLGMDVATLYRKRNRKNEGSYV